MSNVARLRVFLTEYVEDYLFGDLRSMAAVSTPNPGGVGYPMVATALAGIELFGALTSQNTFSKRDGAIYFESFWKTCYPAGHQSAVGPLVYQLARHGLAHGAFAKPFITVIKDLGAQDLHLYRETHHGTLIIHALTLHADLEKAYRTSVVPQIGATMATRLNEMLAEYDKQARQQRPVLDTVPFLGSSERTLFTTLNASTASVGRGAFIANPADQRLFPPTPTKTGL